MAYSRDLPKMASQALMAGMDDWHGWLAWMTGMDDWHR